MASSVSVLYGDQERVEEVPLSGVAILESDFGTSTPFRSPAFAPNKSLTIAKYSVVH